MLVKLLGSTDTSKHKGPCHPPPSPGVILTFSEHFLCAKHYSSLQLQEVDTVISTSQVGKARHRQVKGPAQGFTGGPRWLAPEPSFDDLRSCLSSSLSCSLPDPLTHTTETHAQLVLCWGMFNFWLSGEKEP